MPGLGLGIGLSNAHRAAPGPVYDLTASDWFARVEAAGSVFATGAKAAYNTFISQLKTDGNFTPFSNGMFLAFAGFTGLPGCFVPITSRGNALPTNVGFVSGQKSVNALQGNSAAYIGTGLQLLSGQQNNHNLGFYASAIHTNTTSVLIGNSDTGGSAGSAEIFDNVTIQRTVRASSSLSGGAIARSTGTFFANRTAAAQFIYYSASTNATVTAVSSTPRANNMNFMAASDGGAASNATHQAMYFGDALPAPVAFRTALNNLMISLGVG